MRTKIIVEFASSWNADSELMMAMVKAAAEAGADICKLQDYRAKHVSDSDPDKARYEKYQMRDELYPLFINECKKRGVEPLTSVFNADRAEFIASLGFKKVKIASVCLTNHDLLMFAGHHFDEVIASTAMQSRESVGDAADLLATNARAFTLMACTAEYPCEAARANVSRMDSLREMLDGQEYASVGYSSHALDIDVPKMAVAKGAKYLEVHFSLSRSLPQTGHQMYQGGPTVTTHEVSLEPRELRELADWRDKVALMSGDGEFTSSATEERIRSRYSGRYGK